MARREHAHQDHPSDGRSQVNRMLPPLKSDGKGLVHRGLAENDDPGVRAEPQRAQLSKDLGVMAQYPLDDSQLPR